MNASSKGMLSYVMLSVRAMPMVAMDLSSEFLLEFWSFGELD
jgi:hypothetical protein